MTNFDYLKEEPKFSTFADVAISAEKIILMDPQASVVNSRRAMEFAIKWMYSVEKSLAMPYQDNLYSLMSDSDFRQFVGENIWKRLDYIRACGNTVAHTSRKSGRDEAMLCLENLAIFLDFVACCYSHNYQEHIFDRGIINARIEKIKKSKQAAAAVQEELAKQKEHNAQQELDLKKLIEENAALKEELSARRKEQKPQYIPKPLDLSEYETRKLYIDVMLREAGWIEGQNWINEVDVADMPSISEMGRIDYVLYDERQIPLAIIEAKRTCVDVVKGRHQAKLYADALEKEYGRRPVIFLTNGFDTRIVDGQYPERKCAGIYSKRDLEKWFNLRKMRTRLNNVTVDKEIAGRYYQEAAIKAVCSSFDEKNRRKALLVMATGSGKTRTVIALCKILLEAGWVKNILFLADRNSLVTQAKRNFVNLMEGLSCTNLVEEKDNYNARAVFSTYQTMMHCIDTVNDKEGKIFTCGHFDLIICDEAHRSIYNKYRDIFNYFDAPLVGLTATPKDEIDKNTYEIFELENGVPTYGYDLAAAVKDGYLVDYVSCELELKFLKDGIVYDDLPDDEKEIYEATFETEDGKIPESIDSSALNQWLFNEDTIRKVLNEVMTKGIKVDYGEKIGKTIIFAKNHRHAEKIQEVFYKEYPYLVDYAKVIDNYTAYVQSAIDEFSDPKKLPQIAISVDMLDTGIDIPEIVNLVFFKKVMSKAKFWQMIGRGTRTCSGLLDGQDKEKFYIFDFCGNFEFFRANSKGKETGTVQTLQSSIFNLQFELSFKLQDIACQVDRLIEYRKALVHEMAQKVQQLPKNNFAVSQHLRYVEMYSLEDNYQNITYEDTLMVKEEVAPLILPDKEDAKAVRFDALMYHIELASLAGKSYTRAIGDLQRKVTGLARIAHIPEIQQQKELIHKILNTDYVQRAGMNDFEEIRMKLRDLMKYVSDKEQKYDVEINLTDEILSTEWKESELESDMLKNYKAKAEYYIRQHQDKTAIAKLKTNQPLTASDITELEDILWKEIGTKKDYENEVGTKPLGEFVREIVGLDMNTAKEAFSEYLKESNMDSRQIYFVNQIVEYIVQNGMMKDFSVLQESPFTDRGSITEIFTDMNVWIGIKKVIDSINANAAA